MIEVERGVPLHQQIRGLAELVAWRPIIRKLPDGILTAVLMASDELFEKRIVRRVGVTRERCKQEFDRRGLVLPELLSELVHA